MYTNLARGVPRGHQVLQRERRILREVPHLFPQHYASLPMHSKEATPLLGYSLFQQAHAVQPHMAARELRPLAV